MRNQAMTLRLISNAALGAVLALVLQVGSVNAQNGSPPQDQSGRSYPVVSEETYNRVLDVLFPRNAPPSSNIVWSIVLRFKPSFRAESQIIIRRSADRIEIVEYTSVDGSIYRAINATLSRTGREDPVEMARAIRVNRRVVSVPSAQVRRWYAAFFDGLASTTRTLRERGQEFDRTGGESFVLDGAVYDLWYEQGLNRISFSLYDVEVDNVRSSGEFGLVRWMNAVRRDVGRQRQ